MKKHQDVELDIRKARKLLERLTGTPKPAIIRKKDELYYKQATESSNIWKVFQ